MSSKTYRKRWSDKDEPDERQLRIADRQLQDSAARVDAKEPSLFADLNELIRARDAGFPDQEAGDVALPFLIFVDTRIQ